VIIKVVEFLDSQHLKIAVSAPYCHHQNGQVESDADSVGQGSYDASRKSSSPQVLGLRRADGSIINYALLEQFEFQDSV
jgi:hypothetical protein